MSVTTSSISPTNHLNMHVGHLNSSFNAIIGSSNGIRSCGFAMPTNITTNSVVYMGIRVIAGKEYVLTVTKSNNSLCKCVQEIRWLLLALYTSESACHGPLEGLRLQT